MTCNVDFGNYVSDDVANAAIRSPIIDDVIELIRAGHAPVAPLNNSRSPIGAICEPGKSAIASEMLEQFNRSYYLRNLIKCTLALEELNVFIPHGAAFVDIGSGLGTFSHALLSRRRFGDNSFELLDRSSFQIRMAQLLAFKLSLPIQFHYSCGDICHRSRAVDQHFLLASYSMCEVFSEQENHALDFLFGGLGAMVIDYPSVIARISAMARKRGVAVVEAYAKRLRVPLPIRDLIGQPEVQTSYVLLTAN